MSYKTRKQEDNEMVARLRSLGDEAAKENPDLYRFLTEVRFRLEEAMCDEDDMQEMAAYAVRYALGRRTYATGAVSSFIRAHTEMFKTGWLERIQRDIHRAESEDNLGDPIIDAPLWMTLSVCIGMELASREIDSRREMEEED